MFGSFAFEAPDFPLGLTAGVSSDMTLDRGASAPAERLFGRVAGAYGAPGGGAPPPAAGLPFLLGSNQYREAPFFTVSQLLDGNSHEQVQNITPGNFLRGITLQVTSTGGVLGTTAALAADAPFSILSSISLEDISGGPILYPMGGYAYAKIQKWLRPWDGDPALRPDFSNTINPAFTLRLFTELQDTVGVLANTDARAQYRLRFTIAPLVTSGAVGLVNVSTGVTGPTVTVKGYVEMWSSPDLQDLLGNPIDQVPMGLVCSRFNMHEIPSLTSGGNVIRATLVGNELRALMFIVRNGNSANSRINLTDTNTGAIDVRLDNRRLWKMYPTQWVEEMNAFYQYLALGTWTRDTGVYVYPRFRAGVALGGEGQGDYWLQTVEQTLLQLEFNGADVTTSPGGVEIIYDALAIAGDMPHEFEGI